MVDDGGALKAGYSLADMDMRACMGLQAIMQTIMMGKMEMVLPDMYMMNRFMGICFRGPRATSQQRCRSKRETEGRDFSFSHKLHVLEELEKTRKWPQKKTAYIVAAHED